MRLPEVRAELLELAGCIGAAGYSYWAERIEYLARQTKRRSPVRRAPRQRRGALTHTEVISFLSLFPNADYEAIASAYNSNVGRVSEALRGERA